MERISKDKHNKIIKPRAWIFLLCTYALLIGCTQLSINSNRINNSSSDSNDLNLNSSSVYQEWQDSLPIEFATSQAGATISVYRYVIETSASGDSLIVWSQAGGSGTDYAVFKSERNSGVWTHPSSIHDHVSLPGVYANFFDVKMNDAGDAIISYSTQANGIFVATRNSGVWDIPTSLSETVSFDDTALSYHSIAMNNSGDAVLCWNQSDGTRNQVYLSELNSGAWTKPSNLADNISQATSSLTTGCNIDINNSGEAILAWGERDGSSITRAYISERSSGVWGAKTAISPAATSIQRTPLVDMNNSGNAIVVWQQTNGTRSHIFMSERVSGVWDNPDDENDHISNNGYIPTAAYLNAEDPDIALNDSDEAIIAWDQNSTAWPYENDVFISTKTAGSWTHPGGVTGISPTQNLIGGVSVSINPSGDAAVAWSQYDSNDDLQVYASQRVSGSWTHPASVNDYLSYGGEHFGGPDVVIDTSGDIFAVYTDSLTKKSLFLSEKVSGSWTNPADVSDKISSDANLAKAPAIAVNSSGNALIAWIANDGTRDQVYISERVSGIWDHPTGLNDVISTSVGTATTPRVALNDNDDAIVAWLEASQIYKSEKTSGTWTHPSNSADYISPVGATAFLYLYPIAMNDSGDALILWVGSFGGFQLYMSERASGTWTHPGTGDNFNIGTSIGGDVSASINSNGDAIIAWNESDGSTGQIFIAEKITGTWDFPTLASDNISPNGQYASGPSVSLNDSGEVALAWTQSDGSNRQTFIADGSMGSLSTPAGLNNNISPDGADVVTRTALAAIDRNGDIVVTWLQSNGTNDQVFVSEKVSGSWTNPSSLTSGVTESLGYDFSSLKMVMDNNGDTLITCHGTGLAIHAYTKQSGIWYSAPESMNLSYPISSYSYYDIAIAKDANTFDPLVVYGAYSTADTETGARVVTFGD